MAFRAAINLSLVSSGSITSSRYPFETATGCNFFSMRFCQFATLFQSLDSNLVFEYDAAPSGPITNLGSGHAKL
jgi:hypothetical protein